MTTSHPAPSRLQERLINWLYGDQTMKLPTVEEVNRLFAPSDIEQQDGGGRAPGSSATCVGVPNFDGRDFYELCQQYRHCRRDPIAEFEAIIKYAKTGLLPWQSYERDDERGIE